MPVFDTQKNRNLVPESSSSSYSTLEPRQLRVRSCVITSWYDTMTLTHPSLRIKPWLDYYLTSYTTFVTYIIHSNVPAFVQGKRFSTVLAARLESLVESYGTLTFWGVHQCRSKRSPAVCCQGVHAGEALHQPMQREIFHVYTSRCSQDWRQAKTTWRFASAPWLNNNWTMLLRPYCQCNMQWNYYDSGNFHRLQCSVIE